MPINLDLPNTSCSVDKSNDIHIKEASNYNDEIRTSIEQQRNKLYVAKLLPTRSRKDNLPHPHLLKYYKVDSLYANKQPSCKHLSTTCISVQSNNVKAVLNNGQSKYLTMHSSSLEENTRMPPKKQMTCSEHNLNSDAVASLKFSIKIPIKQLYKLHLDPKQISCETSQQSPVRDYITSTESSSSLQDNQSIQSKQLDKHTFHRSALNGVHAKNNPLRIRKQIKNVALQTERHVGENLSSNYCKNISGDPSMQSRFGLERSNTHYQRIEPKGDRFNTSIQTKSDNQELQHGNQCCCCPLQFESSSSTNLHSNRQPAKDQSQTGYHNSGNLKDKSSRNIIMNHIPNQLNQTGNCAKVISKDVLQPAATETTCSHALPSLVTKKSVDKAISIHSIRSTSTLMTNITCNSLCDCVCFNDDSSDSQECNSTCGLCFNTDWSETNNSEDEYQDYNFSTISSKCSNPCQLHPECSHGGCKCLLWNDNSADTFAHTWNAREYAQNESKLSQTETCYDSHSENNNSKTNEISKSKLNCGFRQMEKERTIETDYRVPQKQKEVSKKREMRPLYKLSEDSNVPDNCKFAQLIQRGEEPKCENSIREQSNTLQVTKNLPQACMSTDLTSMNCLIRNNERNNESSKKVHFSQEINSQIISPCYKTSFEQTNKHNCWISSNFDGQRNVSQSKVENKQLHSKHSSLELQLKSKLRYGAEPKKIHEHSSMFDDAFDANNITEQVLLLSTEDNVSSNRTTIEMVSTTSATDYILSDSTPVTSRTPTSSKSSVSPYEMHTTSSTPRALYPGLNSETNLHKTKSNLINTTFLNSCMNQWKNNSVTSLCNVSALDVSNETEQQAFNERIFLSEIPINTRNKMSSSTECNAMSTSDTEENTINSIHSNDASSVSYPVFSYNNARKVNTNGDGNLHKLIPLTNSLVSQGATNLHRAQNNCPYNRIPISKTSGIVSKQQETYMSEAHPMAMQQVNHRSIAVQTHNNPGKVAHAYTCIGHSLEKNSRKISSKWLSENMPYDEKSSKQIKVIYKKKQGTNCTETIYEHSDAPSNTQCVSKQKVQSSLCHRTLPSKHISRIQAEETLASEYILETNKKSKWDPKLNKQLKIHKPNWDELATTVNKLQMICNDHTASTEQSMSSTCRRAPHNDTDGNDSSETSSILAAQACIEIIQKQLGIRRLHENHE